MMAITNPKDEGRDASGAQEAHKPERPSLRSANNAPVLVKVPAPIPVRIAQVLWVSSFIAGAVGIIYLSIIREDQLPLISEMVEAVDSSRAEETYERAASTIFWSAFAVMVGLLLAQITFLVSFMNRKPGTRWWQFGSWIVQVPAYLLIIRMVALGDKGELLDQTLTIQLGLIALGLGFSVLPRSMAWSYRRHDVRQVDDPEGLTEPEP